MTFDDVDSLFSEESPVALGMTVAVIALSPSAVHGSYYQTSIHRNFRWRTTFAWHVEDIGLFSIIHEVCIVVCYPTQPTWKL